MASFFIIVFLGQKHITACNKRRATNIKQQTSSNKQQANGNIEGTYLTLLYGLFSRHSSNLFRFLVEQCDYPQNDDYHKKTLFKIEWQLTQKIKNGDRDHQNAIAKKGSKFKGQTLQHGNHKKSESKFKFKASIIMKNKQHRIPKQKARSRVHEWTFQPRLILNHQRSYRKQVLISIAKT